MTPRATIVHRMEHRVRIRIAGVKKMGDGYFQHMESILKRAFDYQHISVSPTTATILLADPALDLEAVTLYSREIELFDVNTQGSPFESSVLNLAATLVDGMDSGIRRITGNRLEIVGTVFLVLIVHAVRELIRGNLKTPSLFTALWMAYTLYYRQNKAGTTWNTSCLPMDNGGDYCE